MAVRIGNKVYGADATQTGNASSTGMSEQADTEPDVTDPNEPTEGEGEAETPAQAGAQAAQMSQAEANYHMGSPTTKCGNCIYYNIGTNTFQFGRCTKVQGNISTYGVCDIYRRIANPFPPALTPQEMQQLEQWYWQKAAEKGLGPQTTQMVNVRPGPNDQPPAQPQAQPQGNGQQYAAG